jgi:hypothetical protein
LDLRKIKAEPGICQQNQAVRRTFELYVFDQAGQKRFQPLLCERMDVVQRARQVLTEQEAQTVEVWEAGEHLLTLAR